MSGYPRFFAAPSGEELYPSGGAAGAAAELDGDALRRLMGYSTVRAEFEYRVEFLRVHTYDLMAAGEAALREGFDIETVPPILVVPRAYLTPEVIARAVPWWEERGPVRGAMISEVVGADPIRVMTTYLSGLERSDEPRIDTDEIGG